MIRYVSTTTEKKSREDNEYLHHPTDQDEPLKTALDLTGRAPGRESGAGVQRQESSVDGAGWFTVSSQEKWEHWARFTFYLKCLFNIAKMSYLLNKHLHSIPILRAHKYVLRTLQILTCLILTTLWKYQYQYYLFYKRGKLESRCAQGHIARKWYCELKVNFFWIVVLTPHQNSLYKEQPACCPPLLFLRQVFAQSSFQMSLSWSYICGYSSISTHSHVARVNNLATESTRMS